MAFRLAVTFIRHGMTKWNEEHRYLGWSDLPLSNEGKKIVRSFSLPLYKPDVIITSDLLRCIETAKLLYQHTRLVIEPRLREINFGVWEGRTFQQLTNVTSFNKWLAHRDDFAPEEGETMQQFQERVFTAWEQLIDRERKRQANEVCLIVHAGVIRYLLTKLTNEWKSFWEWEISFQHAYRITLSTDEKGVSVCTSLQVVPLMENSLGYSVTIN